MRHDVAVRDIAASVLGAERPQHAPRADIAPGEGGRHDNRIAGAFHYRAVDGVLGYGEKSFAVSAHEVQIALRTGHRFRDRADDFRPVALQLGKVAVSAKGEHTAVPEIAAGGEKALSSLQARLLDEALHDEGLALRRALPDITITCVRAGRFDA